MGAAYASLVSLLNTMDQMQNHPLLSTCFRKYPNEYIREKIDLFLDFLEKHWDAESEEAEDLVRRIEVAAREAEDIIEVQVAYCIRSGLTERSFVMPRKLQKIIQEMDSIKRKVIIINRQTAMVENSLEAEVLVRRMAAVALEADEINPSLMVGKEIDLDAATMTAKEETCNTTTTMVGFDAYLEQLLEQLIGQHSGRRILPIVGMGGIGKTTLARSVYENEHTVDHFDVRAWVAMSQQFSIAEILSEALSCLGGSTSRTDSELGDMLHKTLFGRRYLIVLDDVWSVEPWEKIQLFLPEDNNGSRIVITTRQSELVQYFGSSPLALDFLDDKNSWLLFCKNAFPQQSCPSELLQIGKKVVEKCKGLPLAIIVVAGLLGKSPTAQEYWERIAEDKNFFLNLGESRKPLSILYLSYKHLPIWLKPCFVYLGLFPEDHRIDVSQLISLWVAEGFVKPNSYQSLEEVAENYIKDLVDRNLVLVGGLRLNKKLKTCYIHDLVRDLCVMIAEKENYFCVQRSVDGMSHIIVDERNARFYPHTSKTVPSILHPLSCRGQREMPYKSRLLIVLFSKFEEYPFGEVNLRFLFQLHGSKYELYSSISQLWSLQTLIVNSKIKIVAPDEVWKMPQLRHIKVSSIYLPAPVSGEDAFVLENLQTLGVVLNLIFSKEVCRRIPNVKDLQIHYNLSKASSCYHLDNVGLLNKLESLEYSCSWGREGAPFLNLKLPSSLKELSLKDCKLVWSDLAMIGSLPHLCILSLGSVIVLGGEWKCGEQEFLSLKHLGISRCDSLIKWNVADSSSFPLLETLYLEHLTQLEEVPPCVGEKATLERMKVAHCSESSTISALNLLEEQEDLGNLGLQLQLHFLDRTEAETWRSKIKELSFTCQNVRIYISRFSRKPPPGRGPSNQRLPS